MAEKDHNKESENNEQTASDEALAQYLSLPVIEQQSEQLDDMIATAIDDLEHAKSIPENGYDEDKGEGAYFGDYVALASSFFDDDVAFLMHLLAHHAQTEQFNNKNDTTYCMESMLYLLKLCKVNPELMLSGKYPSGGIMERVPIA